MASELSRPRGAGLVLAALVMFTACFRGPHAPNVAPRGTLALGEADPKDTSSHGPFAVVFAGPRGAQVDPSEVTVVFNRPMRALDLAGDEAKAPVVMTPAVKGHWNWVGTSGLVFSPDDRLPNATDFKVEVPAGTRALDGSTLAKSFSFAFSTPRPELVRTEPYEGANDLTPDSKIDLRFNQKVADKEILRAVSLSVDAAKATKVAFTVKRPDAKNEQLVELVPTAALPLAAKLSLHIDASLRGEEGTLDAGKERTVDFATYGPLAVERLACDDDTPHHQCAPDGGFVLELSNAVKYGDAKKALSISPAAKIKFPTWRDDDSSTRSIEVYGKFKPGTRYRVHLASTLKDEHGQSLSAGADQSAAFDDFWPEGRIGVRGEIFEPNVKRDVPIATINVASFDLATAPLTEDRVLSYFAPGGHNRFDSLFEITSLRGSSKRTVTPGAALNTVATEQVSTDRVLGGSDKRGPLAMGMSFTSRPGTQRARLETHTEVVQVTELALSAKVSPYGTLVWVTKLADAQPVEGADVWIRRDGEPMPQVFKTDRDGRVTVPPSVFMPFRGEVESAVVFAKQDGDWTFKAVRDTLAGYRFGASPDFREERPIAMLFTERGIYRPGDTVKLKGIVRREARVGTTTPAGEPVDVAIAGPDGDEIAKLTPTLTPFGTFAVDVKIPDTGRLGTYEARVALGTGNREGWDANESFEVAEYRAAEFKAAVESDKPSYVRGDKATWIAHGDYLFGAPMAKADVHLTVTHDESSFAVPNTDGFVTSDAPYWFDREDATPTSGELQAADAKLDGKGTASLGATLTLPGAHGAQLVTCEAEITDVSRQVIGASSSAIVHPAEFYVAMKPPADLFVPAKTAVAPEILAVDPRGARVASQAVHVELVQRTFQIAKQTVGGGVRTSVEPVDKTLASCDVKTASSPVSCSLTPPSGGYFILRATSKDRRGNAVASSAPLYVLGDGETGWGDSDTMAVKLVPDKKSYEIGQTAHVLVKSPWKSAEALVTVERAGVHTSKRMKLSGGMPTVDVPITDELRPNAFVSVLLERPRTKAPPTKIGRADVGAPSFRMGYAELPVNPESRRFSVAIKTNKSDYKPGEAIDVDVDVKDRKGSAAKSEVTLYAVDEGVLSLVGYKTPDPIAVFGAPRSLKVTTLEARASLASVWNPFANLGLDKGMDGGGGGGEAHIRKDFRASAYYNPTLYTDARGHAHATFKLPESLTTYRVMAVAAGEDDRFGYAESKVTASRPLMARPAFPRFLRAGDDFEAGVVVNLKGIEKQKVDVEIAVDGLVLKEAAKKSVDVDAKGGVEVRFAMSAPKAGKVSARFKATSGAFQDAVEITRDVQIPSVMEAVALYGDTTEAAAEKLGDLSAIRDDVGGLDVALSSTALVGLNAGLEQLTEYPYGCTEQLTSKLVPMLPLRDLAKDYGFALPRDVDAIAAKTVAEVLTHQRGDGGFGMWAESTESSPWASVYGVWGLLQADKYKVNVPKSALDAGVGYLRSVVGEFDRDDWTRATAAFAADVLAEADAPDPGLVDRLFLLREKLPLFSRALLLHAMVLTKSDKASIATLASELEGHLRLDGNKAIAIGNDGDHYAALMDSDARTTALVLRSLLAVRPDHPLGSKLAMGLLGARKGGTWRSTQETAWALLSLDDYRRAQEKTAPNFDARVFLGDNLLFESPFKGRSLDQAKKTIPASALASSIGAPLSFTVDGTGKLFYEARLKYARKVMPRNALERGFFVKKTLRKVTAETLVDALKGGAENATSSAFDGGDLVLGEIVVVTPTPREFVAVEDPLPAGFEAIDARLATTGASLDVDRAEERADEDDAVDNEDNDQGDVAADSAAMGKQLRSTPFVRELKDDRVLFFIDHLNAGMYRYRYLARATSIGTFLVPPAKAEEMYQPEVFGRTGAATVTVRAK